MSAILYFFYNDTATTEIYTLSLHDALPILGAQQRECVGGQTRDALAFLGGEAREEMTRQLADIFRPLGERRQDRKSTRLNSSHLVISYAVFCLKNKMRTTRFLCTFVSMPPH